MLGQNGKEIPRKTWIETLRKDMKYSDLSPKERFGAKPSVEAF